MAQWYVKQLSKLTKVSVRTLHHYDRIDLLKPSLRLENGYRLYSESDLLQLQRIIALKYFGFNLSKIRVLINAEEAPITQPLLTAKLNAELATQAKLLEEKANTLLTASRILKEISQSECSNNSISWESIIKMIEVYNMTEELEDSWVNSILTTQELHDYACFKEELKTKYTPAEKNDFEHKWSILIEKVKNNVHEDPASNIGVNTGKQVMDLINGLYGKKYANLRKTIWDKGFKAGNAPGRGLNANMIAWLDKAISAYYHERSYSILVQIETKPKNTILPLWLELVEEICGGCEQQKNELYQVVLSDPKVSTKAKDWLKNNLTTTDKS